MNRTDKVIEVLTKDNCRNCIHTINQTEDLDGWKAICNNDFAQDYLCVVTEDMICYCHEELRKTSILHRSEGEQE